MSECPMCHRRMENGKTTFTSDLGFGVIVVRQVPAQVCGQCGESWLSDATSEGLEKVVNDLRQKHSMVEVLNWQDVDRLAA
ncbi:MAG: type II toxin-antitoxin system MqsA family antitoxin [Mariprofundaceae bacterium]